MFLDGEDNSSWAYEHYLSYRSLKAADNVRAQLARQMERLSLPLKSPVFGTKAYYDVLKRALVAGFFMQAAHVEPSGSYLTIKDNQLVKIHPSSVLDVHPQWVIYNEFVLTTQHYIRTVTEIKCEWLLEMSPKYYALDTMPACSAKRSLEEVLLRRHKMSEKTEKLRGKMV